MKEDGEQVEPDSNRNGRPSAGIVRGVNGPSRSMYRSEMLREITGDRKDEKSSSVSLLSDPVGIPQLAGHERQLLPDLPIETEDNHSSIRRNEASRLSLWPCRHPSLIFHFSFR